MHITDPIADMLTRIRNANAAKHTTVDVPASNMKKAIADILLNEGYIRRDVVWFTDKSREGATQLKRLSSLGLHKTMNPYHAYKQGKLVDLPFLGSIYLDKED